MSVVAGFLIMTGSQLFGGTTSALTNQGTERFSGHLMSGPPPCVLFDDFRISNADILPCPCDFQTFNDVVCCGFQALNGVDCTTTTTVEETTTTVEETTTTAAQETTTTAAATTTSPSGTLSTGGQLPRTGGDSTGALLLGSLVVVFGAMVLALTRRPATR